MANYAVRIYDPELKAWLIAEAERRGAGIRTSDIVEAALRFYRGHVVDEGSLARPVEVSPSADGALPVGDAPDRAAAPADAAAGEAVVQPMPPVDPASRLDASIAEMNAITKAVVDAQPMPSNAVDRTKKFEPVLRYEPVVRETGPDSGPDPELGF